MKSPPRMMCLLFLVIFLARYPRQADAQIELVSSDFFPADLEFRELKKIKSDYTDAQSAGLAAADLRLFEEAGYDRYAQRTYEVSPQGNLSVEVLTARDERAAFSVFTLLRGEPAIVGPPGDWYCLEKEVLTFSRGNYWVRLRAVELPDLMRRVAVSVGNRIGPRPRTLPSLISHLPQKGLNSSSIRYFVGERSFIQYSGKVPGLEFKFGPEMEVAQASYEFQSQSGMLSLISFPTVQMAQQFFDQTPEAVLPGSLRIFTRRVGPLVGVLAGGFEPAAADTILGGMKFSYTIKWIYDKNNNSSKTIWGVPVKILGTVVRSLLLTAILCVGSVFFGVGIAMFRILLRGYAPGNYLDRPERTEMIRLRLSDKPHAIPEDSDRRLPGR